MIKQAWERGVPCWLCGLPFMARSDITCDHYVTLRDGGSHELDNLRPAHEACNKGRFRRKPKEKPAPVIDTFVQNNEYLEW
jgi:5-methylcytosine-specific restriction endonuclease McrA